MSQSSPDIEQNEKELQNLTPLTVIRTETVISKLPVHNLAKRGIVNIHITQENQAGSHKLFWEVRPGGYGQPRQLAYKLDTIVINRKLDELGRPLPKVIKLGSLGQIARELGSTRKDMGELKLAFRQNATAAINAKLHYKASDGTEREIDATFTRYSVVFTGEKLPEGKKANAVYLILNDVYFDVLNSAPIRPLDYDYLKALTPAAQRFYEIVSYKMFAAFSFGRPEARLAYSDYCTFAAQARYYDYDHFKKQMYKVHRPHLQSGYLKLASYKSTTDGEGKQDWNMYYVPGSRATAQYHAFAKKHASRIQYPQESLAKTQDGSPSRQPELPSVVSPQEIVQQFHARARGIKNHSASSKEVAYAAELLRLHGLSKVLFIVEHAIRSAERTKFWMQTFGAIRQYVPEALTAFDRTEREEKERRRIEAEREAAHRGAEETSQKAQLLLGKLAPGERQALYDELKTELTFRYPAVASWKPEIFKLRIDAAIVEKLQEHPN